jgi:hypothetical protein
MHLYRGRVSGSHATFTAAVPKAVPAHSDSCSHIGETNAAGAKWT